MLPTDVKHLVSPSHNSNSSTPDNGHSNGNIETLESVLALLSPSLDEDASVNGTVNGLSKKKKKSTKGWDGEAVVVAGDGSSMFGDHDGMSLRLFNLCVNV